MADPCSFFSDLTVSEPKVMESSESTGNLRTILVLPFLCILYTLPTFDDLDDSCHWSIFQTHPVLSSSISWVYLGWTLINFQLFPCFVPAWPIQVMDKIIFFEIPIFFLIRLFYPLKIIADQKIFKFFSSEHSAWRLIQSFCSIFPLLVLV